MRLETWFRVLNHATLALASLCLIAAEDHFLPWIWYAAGPVLLVIALGGWGEERWLLPAGATNCLGAIIALGGGWWMLAAASGPGGVYSLPLPTAIVPYLGPVLIALLLVKLFRPRTNRDFWLLQGLGLLQVSLGCVLANGALFGSLLIAYLLAGLGCLTLAHLKRQQAAAARSSEDLAAEPVPLVGLGLPFLLRWGVAIGGLSVGLFLLAPRTSWQTWSSTTLFHPNSPERSRVTGFTESINLNRTSRIELSNEIAFLVSAHYRDDRPRDDLPPSQRWRGLFLEKYENGEWTQDRLPRRNQASQNILPDFGPDEWLLKFTVRPSRAGTLFLADPICFGPPGGGRLPVVSWDSGMKLFLEFSGSLVPHYPDNDREYHYHQVVAAHADPDRVSADPLIEPVPQPLLPNVDEREFLNGTASGHLRDLKRLPDEIQVDLHKFAARLVQRLAAGGHYGILPEDAGPASDYAPWQPCPANAERVARGLAMYLAVSGDYTYSLEARRHNRNLDPVLDFLTNVKDGHCDRFASALALLLRARGIPARLVKGFRGVEPAGNGAYIVRQYHAHTWVEALVPREKGRSPGYDWLTLDPTPAGGGADSPAQNWITPANVWHDLILNYNSERQAVLWSRLFSDPAALVRVLGWLALGVGLAGLISALLYWRRRWRRARASRPHLPAAAMPALACFARLLALLARYACLSPRPDQTPREFAQKAAVLLRSLPGIADLAAVPDRVVEFYYEVRFGGHSVDRITHQQLGKDLDGLQAALESSPPRRIAAQAG